MEYIILFFIFLYLFKNIIVFFSLFQQNGYKINKYFKNLKKYYLKTTTIYLEYINILILFLYSFNKKWYLGIVSIILIIIPLIKSKKLILLPKITKRVIRLLITVLVVYVIPHLFFNKHLFLYFLESIFFPFIIIFSSIINRPIEKIINNYYELKTKKKLKEIKPLIIGITGSFGKTSTKKIIHSLISNNYYTYSTPKSYNTPMGICKGVNDMNYGVEVFISELGATSKGDISKLVELVDVNIGIITDIGPQHLESFKTIDNVLKTKLEILESKSIKKLIINNDNRYLRETIYPETIDIITIGIENKADFMAKNVLLTIKGISFDVYYKQKYLFTIKTHLLGKHNIYNLLCGIAIAKLLNINNQEIIKNISKIEPVDNRLSITNMGAIQILKDAFNSNIQGFKNAIEVLKLSENKKILITPGIVDLGSSLKDINTEISKELINGINYIYLIKNEASLIINEYFKNNGFKNYEMCISFQDAYSLAINRYSNSTILIENDLPDNYLRR